MSELFPELGDYFHAHFPELADSLGFPAPAKKGLPGAEMRAATPEELNAPTMQGQMRQADPATAAMMSLPKPVSDAVDALGAVAGKARDLGATPDQLDEKPLQLAQALFHGSPHKFDKFALEHIGEGEGAQVFGHGLYFAENPAVAKEYQARLSSPSIDDLAEYFKPGNIVDGYGGKDKVIEFMPKNGDWAVKVQRVKQDASGQWVPVPGFQGQPRIHMTTPTNEAFQKATGRLPGHLYTVDVPDEHIERMLDWDAPLTDQQKQAALDALGNLQPVYLGGDYYGVTRVMPDGTGQIIKGIQRPSKDEAMREALSMFDGRKGQDAYRMLAATLGGAEKASEALSAAGIPGIRYLDQGSRFTDAGQKTRNFVVFDDSIIKTLKRNGEDLAK